MVQTGGTVICPRYQGGGRVHLRGMIAGCRPISEGDALATPLAGRICAAVTFDGHDLRSRQVDDVLDTAEAALGVRLLRSARTFGTSGATVGMPTASDTWVRLAWRPIDRMHEQSWVGAEHASTISGVRKPALYRSHRWQDEAREVVWRADEMERVRSAAVHPSGVIDTEPSLPLEWWDNLAGSFDALAKHATDRVGMRQEHLTRRINQVFDGQVDTTIDEWTIANADAHWGNLTAPECYLLDWEDWGKAPRGLDVATLWGHSLLVPAVAERIQGRFAADLDTRSGHLAQLVFCSNVIRLNAKRPDPSPLLEPARAEAERLLRSLRR